MVGVSVPDGTSTQQEASHRTIVDEYLSSPSRAPLLIHGEALEILETLPNDVFDCCMTSPPYWGKREYSGGGIGLERAYTDYIDNLCAVFREVRRVLKPTGSFWLNIGDSYQEKNLVGLPWRVALHMMDHDGWVLRNDVIWHKVKGGPDNALDKLRNIHEHVFHFVKNPKGYYYDVDAIRSTPQKAKVVNGAVVSATGVRGVRYRRQIELSTELSDLEKNAALVALDEILTALQAGKLSDFRMIIRKQQRATHSDSDSVSGRARELQQRGFYFLKYNPNGSKPSDVWDIIPEDTHNRIDHFAPYPEDLCRIPIIATCPPQGIVLDPFCGTGTTLLVALNLGRKSFGIDVAKDYIEKAAERCRRLL